MSVQVHIGATTSQSWGVQFPSSLSLLTPDTLPVSVPLSSLPPSLALIISLLSFPFLGGPRNGNWAGKEMKRGTEWREEGKEGGAAPPQLGGLGSVVNGPSGFGAFRGENGPLVSGNSGL